MAGFNNPVFTGGLGIGLEGGSGVPSLPGWNFEGKYRSWQQFVKAVQAGYGTDVAQLTGGGALRRQSLEATLIAILQSNQDFVAFNKLNKSQATATVDEFTTVSGTGSWPGGAVNAELGEIVESSGEYKRFVVQIKFLMDKRRVSVVQDVQNAIAAATATEQMLSTLTLLSSAEWLTFAGDSDVVPEEFDGFYKIINSLHPENVIDAEGGTIGDHAEQVIDAGERIARAGAWGQPSDVFWSTAIQADVDQGLAPAFRVSLEQVPGGGILKGAPVRGIRSSFGLNGQITANYDKFIREGGKPFALEYAGVSMGTDKPADPTIQVQPAAAGTGSKFKSAHAGSYYYAVEAVNRSGRSALVKTNQVTVAAGESVTFTVRMANPASAANGATGLVIYRSSRDGSNADSNFRELKRVQANRDVNNDVVITDDNSDIPGTSKAFVLNLTPGLMAADIRRLLPLTRFNLYPTTRAEIPWAQLLFLALRVAKPQQHVVIKNLLPRSSDWKPF